MASQMDPIKSFTLVHENIPHWLCQLNDLTQQVDDQFQRFSKHSLTAGNTGLRKQKHGSMESLRAANHRPSTPPSAQINHESNVSSTSDSSVPPLTDSTTLECPSAEISDQSRPAQRLQRKRKSSSLSSDSSSCDRHHNTSMVVVDYNSTIQAAFEDIVKGIATARNHLRKGKNAATFHARTASFDATFMSFADVSYNPSPTLKLSSMGKPRSYPHSGPRNSITGFVQADRDLHEAQDLCEQAAYQMLRVGDCRQELQGMRRRLSSCAETTQREVDRLQREADIEAAAAEAQRVLEELPAYVEEEDDLEMSFLDEKVPLYSPRQMVSPPVTEILLPAAGVIEIDDESSDAESMHIDLDAIRRTVRRVPRV